MEGLAQVVGGRLPARVGPQEVHHLFAVEAVARTEGKQLHQGGYLPEPPLAVLDRPRPHRDREAAQQLDANGFESPATDVLRIRSCLGCWSSLRHLHHAPLGTMI